MRKAALGLVVLAMVLQPLVVCAALVVDDANDSDDLVFGGDPVVIGGAIALPLLEPRADVVDPAPAHALPRVGDPADHPPRLA